MMRAVLHGGPCDGNVDTSLLDPSPNAWPALEIVPPYPDLDRPLRPRDGTPELHTKTHWYELDRVEGDTAHYTHRQSS
jgi:hypothetical protein